MSYRSIQSGFNFEHLMWLFTRLSGVALVALAMIGLLGALGLEARSQVDLPTLMRWTFFPNPNHVESSIPDVTLGWANGFWQIMQILIVFLGATHGFNGLRAVIEDFEGKSEWKPLLRGVVFLLWIFVLMMALYIILAL
jgi:succinate dehydrogenase hydrophobic anchor subunit